MDRTDEVPDYTVQRAVVHAMAGEDEAALTRLEQAYQGGYQNAGRLEFAPFFDDIREDPRYRALIDQMRADRERMRRTIEREELATGER